MKVKVQVTLKKSVLDPQGEVIRKGLHSLGFDEVEQVRMGKYFELDVRTERRQDLEIRISQMCEKLLSNPVIEDYALFFPEEEG